MEANVVVADRRLKHLTELIEQSKDQRVVKISVDHLKLYQECIVRLAALERHIHNLNVGAYQIFKVVK